MAEWQICILFWVGLFGLRYVYTLLRPLISESKQFTPIEKIEHTTSHQHQQPYDFFISYRGINAPLVRSIVEQLLGAGYKVWFDEYVISLGIKTLRDQTELDHRLHEIIPRGIAQSQRAICFTSDTYLQSNWCRMELELILKQLGPSQVLNIQLSTLPEWHEPFSKMALAPTLASKDLAECLHFIDPSITPLLSPDTPTPTVVFPYANWVFELDPKDWRVITNYRMVALDNLEGPKLSRWFEGGLWTGRVMVGEMGYSALRRGGYASDKEFFLRSAQFAQEYFAEVRGHRCVGVHLVMHKGEAHIGLTATAYQRGKWMRIYSIALHDGIPRIKGDTEVFFSFQFTGSFEKFCRSVHYADEVVQSLKWEPRQS